MQKLIGRFLVVVVLAFALGQAMADTILYDNGPIVGDNGRNIGNYQVSDSFTLASDSTLTQVQVRLIIGRGYVPSSVDWSIGTGAFATDLGTGTSTLTNVSFTDFLGGGQVGEWVFPLSSVLNSGTYWLTLTNAWVPVGTDLQPVYWCINIGPSLAQQSTVGGIQSESFQIYGDPVSATPVPSTLAMSSILFGMLGAWWARNRLICTG